MIIKIIHDFIAFLIALAIGIFASYYNPLLTSIGIFLIVFSSWLIASSYFMKPGVKYFFDPRIARSALGSLLVIISILMISVDHGLDARSIGILVIIAIIALTINVYVLDKRVKRSPLKSSKSKQV